ncbi:hypothetical protein TPB0596_44370 [Tsukamurella pulmonis]|uniref:hypothetical protein n=1 Tax=Tsukamurella pulmonis TaxID=47312 RepID=UPI001EE0A1CA|nr:hypothetical protein [Tsukamurella pulmonis]BDD84674.1 hypothetical protein TPB0596_44370 [Tsukamurella pulmonis]
MTTDESVTPDAPDEAGAAAEANAAAERARETAGRGRTVIDERVRRRLIEHAVLTVPGTERRRTLPTRQLPAVRFADRDRNEVDVQIAAQWPLDAARLVPSVRSAIDDELSRSLGAAPTDVHVHITRVSDERTDSDAAFLHRNPPPEPEDSADVRARRKHAPRRTAGASIATVPLLLAILALGVLAVRDSLVSLGWVAGDRWLDAVPRIADNVQWAWWAWPATIGAIVLGLVLVIAAVKPRRRSHAPVTDDLWFGRRVSAERRTPEEVAR